MRWGASIGRHTDRPARLPGLTKYERPGQSRFGRHLIDPPQRAAGGAAQGAKDDVQDPDYRTRFLDRAAAVRRSVEPAGLLSSPTWRRRPRSPPHSPASASSSIPTCRRSSRSSCPGRSTSSTSTATRSPPPRRKPQTRLLRAAYCSSITVLASLISPVPTISIARAKGSSSTSMSSPSSICPPPSETFEAAS